MKKTISRKGAAAQRLAKSGCTVFFAPSGILRLSVKCFSLSKNYFAASPALGILSPGWVGAGRCIAASCSGQGVTSCLAFNNNSSLCFGVCQETGSPFQPDSPEKQCEIHPAPAGPQRSRRRDADKDSALFNRQSSIDSRQSLQGHDVTTTHVEQLSGEPARLLGT